MSEDPASVESGDHYDRARETIVEQLASLKTQDDRLGYVRVALFLAILAFGFFAYFAESGSVFFVLSAVCVAAFLAVVVFNEPIRDRIEQLGKRRKVIDLLIARRQRDWGSIGKHTALKELPQLELSDDQRAVADDLDFFGKSSLFRFVSMASTVPGAECLIRWLAGSADQSDATQRYQAADLLSRRRDERLDFYVDARSIGDTTGNPTVFTEWAESEPWLKSRSYLLVWANISAVIAAGLLMVVIAAVVGLVAGEVAKSALVGLFAIAIVNVLLGAFVLAPAHRIFSIAMTSRRSVQQYQDLFGFAELLNGQSQSSPVDRNELIDRIQDRLMVGDKGASEGMSALASVARMGGLKQSAATFLLYMPLQLWGLWDLRVLKRLEAWQVQYGQNCRGWFDALGELEALMSVAAIHDEQPEWTTPSWEQGGRFVATTIGHPLLPDEGRVCNDVSVGPPGTFLLVTGSNMSGKSTLLRSLGLNVALAAVGSKVCATEFSLTSCELATSIRVSDSLADGVSFYMAELKRLKAVVDHARRLQSNADRVVLFLLDEILQGTNSRERQIAVAQVIRHLTDSGAVGAISTHDLELADDASLTKMAQTVHFRETITPDADGSEKMTFDYKMRDGVSPTTNALRLLEMVGLGEQDGKHNK